VSVPPEVVMVTFRTSLIGSSVIVPVEPFDAVKE
jgi:hypothetical protein